MALVLNGSTGIVEGNIADSAVTTNKVAASNITYTKLASGAAKANWGAGGVLQIAHGTNSTYTSATGVSPTQLGSFDIYYINSSFILSCSINKSSSTSKLIIVGQYYFAYTGADNGSHGCVLWYGTDSISKIRFIRHDINRSSGNNSSYGIALPCHEVFTGLSSGNYTFNFVAARATSGSMSGRINPTGSALSSDQPGQSYSPISTMLIYEVEA